MLFNNQPGMRRQWFAGTSPHRSDDTCNEGHNMLAQGNLASGHGSGQELSMLRVAAHGGPPAAAGLERGQRDLLPCSQRQPRRLRLLIALRTRAKRSAAFIERTGKGFQGLHKTDCGLWPG